MKRKKKLLALLAMLGMLLNLFPAFAEDVSASLSLTQAQEMARKNSRMLQTLAVTKQKLEASLDINSDAYKQSDLTTSIKSLMDAIDRANEKIGALPPGDPEIDYWENRIEIYENNIAIAKRGLIADKSTLLPLKIAYNESKNAFQDMTKTIEDTEKTLNYNVEKLYFAIRDAENSLSLLQKKLDFMGSQLRVERLKAELGMSTSLDEQNMIVQYNQLTNSIDTLKDTKDQTIRQLNDIIGRPLTASLTTIAVPVSPISTSLNYEEFLKKALDNSLELLQKQREIDNNHDYANDTSGSKRKVYSRQEELAAIQLTGLNEEIKQNTLALTESLQAAYQAWETADLSKEKAEISFRNAKIKYDLGLISRLERDAEEVAYLEAFYNEEKASKEWLLAKHRIDLAESGIFI